jgi:hypothetical protein
MDTDRTARIAKNEESARYLLAAGFTTKADQKNAKERASRAFDDARDMIQGVFLAIPHEERTEAQDAVYGGMPYGPHQWRAKHAEMVRADLPAAAEHLPTIERLVALYMEIKAAPLNLKPRNADGTPVRIPHRSESFNPALREQFMAQAPALAEAYERHIRHVFALYLKRFGIGDLIPANLFPAKGHRLTDEERNQQAVVYSVISGHAERVEGAFTGYRLDEAELALQATKYGEEVAMQWFFKTNRKLGELTSAKLVKDSFGYVTVTGEKDGCKVLLRQQVVSKWAPVARKVYHQFPALLYVDGKSTPEAAYADRFKTES